jgi:flagellin
MSLNSINTNVAALRAQENIGAANRSSSSSIARLSSGERIVRAADDVASMSAGTSLRTNVTTLRTALINTSQGSSMLQVADGALSEITDILLRQKAIAVQAGSGSLSASERSFLDQEFQNLTQEVDRLAEQTNFNGVNLLDGSLFDKTEVANASSGAANGCVKMVLETK